MTFNFQNKNALLIGLGPDTNTKFLTIITGYSSALEYVHISAPGTGVFAVSGTSVTVTNTNHNYSGKVSCIYL